MAFFGYFKKGLQINFLNGDVIDEVSSDEDAFTPGLVIYLFPHLMMGLLMFLMMGMFMMMAVESNPDVAATMEMYGGTFKGMSFSFIFLLPLIALVVMLIFVAVLHLFSKILKGEGAFLDYFQTICLATIIFWVSSLLSVIPLLGALIQLLVLLWFIVVLVVITSRVQGFGVVKGLIVVGLPVVLLFVLVAALFVMAGASMMAAGGGMQPM